MSTEKGGEEVDAGDYGAAVGAAVGVVQGEAPAVIEADDEEEPEKEHEGDGGKKPATATTAKGVAAEEESEKASEVSEAFEELPKAEVIPKSPSTTGEGGTEAEEGTAVSTSASSGSVIESDDTASAPVAPGFGDSTGGALALPEAEVVKEVDTSEEDAEAAKAAQAVKRVEENLTKGGLLLTQVKSERKVIRRLVFDGDKPALKWEVDAVFGTKWVKVKLQGSRIVCTSNLVKIGVEGESDFLTFEACDEAEAIAVRVALEARAEKDKPNDKDAAATKHDIETEVDVTEGASSHDL